MPTVSLFSAGEWDASARLQPTMRRTARVWWAFSWRAVIYRFVAIIAASIPLGWVLGVVAALLPRGMAPFVNLTAQIVIDGVVGMFVIYSSILDEDIADFRVALVPRKPKLRPGAVPSASPTPAQ